MALLSSAAQAQPDTSGAIAGSVTDSGGAGLASVAVAVFDADREIADAETDQDGSWNVDRLAAADYTVRFSGPDGGHLPVWYDGVPDGGGPDRVTVRPGQTTSGVDAVMVRGGRLSGRVTDHAGAAVAGATVQAGDPPRSDDTDASGAFTIADLWPGRMPVAVTADRYEPASTSVHLAEGSDTDLDVLLALRELPVQVVAGEDRVATAVAGSRRGFPDGADAAVIASADSFPDALAAAPLAAREGGPLLLVGRRLVPTVAAELSRLGASRATIVGAVAAVSATVQAELARLGLDVQRIAGDGRFDTAALIARAMGPADSGEVVVVSGGDFADAMSAAPLAAAGGISILLSNQDSLPEDTREALAVLQPTRTLVVGGTAAVSDAVLAQLPGPSRIAGPDRHATSAAVAQLLADRGARLDEVAVATGRDYPDGLASAPLVARAGGALLLAHPDPAHGAAVYAFLDRQLGAVGEVVVFGGDAAVGPAVRARLARPYQAAP